MIILSGNLVNYWTCTGCGTQVTYNDTHVCPGRTWGGTASYPAGASRFQWAPPLVPAFAETYSEDSLVALIRQIAQAGLQQAAVTVRYNPDDETFAVFVGDHLIGWGADPIQIITDYLAAQTLWN